MEKDPHLRKGRSETERPQARAYTFDATAEVGRFDEAVDWFSQRFPVTEDLREQLGEFAGSSAWTIASVTQLDAVMAAHQVLTEAIETGEKLEKTVERLSGALEAYGFSGHRLRTIARNNVQAAYSAGRYVQLSDPDLIALRPYRQVDGIADFRQSDICRALDGTTLLASNPWWLTHWPPYHHGGCRTQIRSLAEWETEDVPIEKMFPPADGDGPAEGFGLTPDVAVPWQPKLHRYPDELANTFVDKQQAERERELEEQERLEREAAEREQRKRDAFAAIAEGLAQDGSQARARAGLRHVISDTLGIDSADVTLESRWNRDKLIEIEGSTSYHDWDGGIRLANHHRAASESGARKLGSGLVGSELEFDEQHSLGTLIHEEIHGCGPLTANIYGGYATVGEKRQFSGSAAVEELATELLARRVLIRDLGVPSRFSTYNRTISRAARVVAEETGSFGTWRSRPLWVGTEHETVRYDVPARYEGLLADAAERLKRELKPGDIHSSDAFVEAFVERIDGLSDAQRRRITERLRQTEQDWVDPKEQYTLGGDL